MSVRIIDILRRFAGVYFTLYSLPLLFPLLPFGSNLSDQWFLLSVSVGRWLIHNVLHLPDHNTPPYTDRLDLFLFNMLLVVISLATVLLWSLFGRARSTSSRMHLWCYNLVRFALAAEMFVYGWSKLLPYQFWGGEVPLFDLTKPLGQLEPQRLLWAMMGYSRLYAIFAGACEWIGALLVCFRRTATLGAIILLGSMTNVVMLNFGYDVPVKLHALNLLGMALFVAAPDLIRLGKLFLLNQPTTLHAEESPPRTPGMARWMTLGTAALAAWLALNPLRSMIPDLPGGRRPPVPSLYGIFEVDSLARNGVVAPPLLTDTVRFRRIVFERNHWAAITAMSDSVRLFRIVVDSAGRTLRLTTLRRSVGLADRGPIDTLNFSYARPDRAHLELRGLLRGDSVVAWLRHVPATQYRLVNARHRWAW